MVGCRTSPGWHSTGLYAPAGEVITASAPAGTAAKLSLRIGCHTNELWDKETWNRCPEITLHKPLDGETPGGQPLRRADLRGGRQAGRYGGRDDRRRRRGAAVRAGRKPGRPNGGGSALAPAPWAELATSKVILSVPAEVVRQLDDPAPLLQYWDRVLDCDAELAGISHAAGAAGTVRARRADFGRLHALGLSDHDAPRRGPDDGRPGEAHRTATGPGACITRWATTTSRPTGPSTAPAR